jgi:hypothetical protein
MFFALRLRNFGQIVHEYLAPALRMGYFLHCVRRTADRFNEVLNSMMKTFTTLTAAATLAVALSAAVPTDANAQWRRGWGGPAIGLGILGGIVVGSMIASQYGPQYVVEPGYQPYAYRAAAPVGCPGGYWARRPVVDQWGNVVGYSRPRYMCPEY